MPCPVEDTSRAARVNGKLENTILKTYPQVSLHRTKKLSVKTSEPTTVSRNPSMAGSTR